MTPEILITILSPIIATLIFSITLAFFVNQVSEEKVMTSLGRIASPGSSVLIMRPVWVVTLITLVVYMSPLDHADIFIDDFVFILLWVAFAVSDSIRHKTLTGEETRWERYYGWRPQMFSLILVGLLFSFEIIYWIYKIYI